MSERGLTGAWDGIFNYPRGLPPTGFTAKLRQLGDALAGETSESCEDGATRQGWLEGTRDGGNVRFVKAYDDPERADYTVIYVGTVNGDASEITGRWEIANVWAGTFIMTRHGGQEAPLEAELAEEVR